VDYNSQDCRCLGWSVAARLVCCLWFVSFASCHLPWACSPASGLLTYSIACLPASGLFTCSIACSPFCSSFVVLALASPVASGASFCTWAHPGQWLGPVHGCISALAPTYQRSGLWCWLTNGRDLACSNDLHTGMTRFAALVTHGHDETCNSKTIVCLWIFRVGIDSDLHSFNLIDNV